MRFKKGDAGPAAFKKGQSGNPGGRPKRTPEIREIALAACPKANRALIAQLDHKDPRIVANAAEKLLDRGIGRPMQAHEITSQTDITVRRTVDVSDWLDAVPEDLKLVTWPPKDRE